LASYRSKPPQGATLNRGDPLSRGLVRAWLFDAVGGAAGAWTFKDRIARESAVYPRNAADTFWRAGVHGRAFMAGATGGSGWNTLGTLGTWGCRTEITVLGFYMKTGGNPNLESMPGVSGSAIVGNSNSGTNSLPVLYTGTGQAAFVVDGPGLGLGARVTPTISSNKWYGLLGSYRKDSSIGTYGGRFRVYLHDGGPVTTAENNYVIGGSFGGTFTDAGLKPFSAGGAAADKVCDCLLVWNRELTPAEARAALADPFRMFRRRYIPVPMFVAAAAGGGNRRRRLICGAAA
jgi:hypothetical protein